jgi:hypothetical protein
MSFKRKRASSSSSGKKKSLKKSDEVKFLERMEKVGLDGRNEEAAQRAVVRRIERAFSKKQFPRCMPLLVDMEGRVFFNVWVGYAQSFDAPASFGAFLRVNDICASTIFLKYKSDVFSDRCFQKESSLFGGYGYSQEKKIYRWRDLPSLARPFSMTITLRSLLECLQLYHRVFLPLFFGCVDLLNIVFDYWQDSLLLSE